MKKKLDRLRLKSLCIHPWSHIAINPDGEAQPCCHTRWTKDMSGTNISNGFGNIKENTVDEIMNCDKMKEIRTTMLSGELPEICSKCSYFESTKTRSPRQHAYYNKYADDVLEDIPKTLPDGSITAYKLRYWDLRYSNVCNMACIMCSPEWSHKWTAEVKSLDASMTSEEMKWNLHSALVTDRERITNYDKVLDISNHLDWVDNGIDDVQKIYFAGGEPLQMEEHWYILEQLDKRNRHRDVYIKYNTNLLKLDYKGKSVLDYWKKWDKSKLYIECSIDETNARAEYIRYGTKWKQILENIAAIKQENINISPIISIGCYNIFRLPELMQELEDLFITADNYFKPHLNPVFTKAFSIPVLPDKYKKQIYKNIKRWEKSTNALRPTLINTFYNQLQKPHDEHAAKAFLRKTAILDASRGNNIFESIPEMEIVNNMYPGVYQQAQDTFFENSTWERK